MCHAPLTRHTLDARFMPEHCSCYSHLQYDCSTSYTYVAQIVHREMVDMMCNSSREVGRLWLFSRRFQDTLTSRVPDARLLPRRGVAERASVPRRKAVSTCGQLGGPDAVLGGAMGNGRHHDELSPRASEDSSLLMRGDVIPTLSRGGHKNRTAGRLNAINTNLFSTCIQEELRWTQRTSPKARLRITRSTSAKSSSVAGRPANVRVLSASFGDSTYLQTQCLLSRCTLKSCKTRRARS